MQGIGRMLGVCFVSGVCLECILRVGVWRDGQLNCFKMICMLRNSYIYMAGLSFM